MKVFVSTIPFGETNSLPIEMLDEVKARLEINPLKRKITTEELADSIGDADVLIAGTEVIDSRVFDKAPNLKLIARVGVGLDGVDLLEARRRGIAVTYTPDAPAPAVAELTIGLMLMLARRIGISHEDMRNSEWQRHFGYRISEMTIGIIGSGRIGSRVIRRLGAFGTPKLLINSLEKDDSIARGLKLRWVSKGELFEKSDLISIHTPLTPSTLNMIDSDAFSKMKKSAMVINTARGGIVNEADLLDALSSGKIHSAAIDVFNNEPYMGPLKDLKNCFLTSHMGSMSFDCRERMEIEATAEAIQYAKNSPQLRLVPQTEYDLREFL